MTTTLFSFFIHMKVCDFASLVVYKCIPDILSLHKPNNSILLAFHLHRSSSVQLTSKPGLITVKTQDTSKVSGPHTSENIMRYTHSQISQRIEQVWRCKLPLTYVHVLIIGFCYNGWKILSVFLRYCPHCYLLTKAQLFVPRSLLHQGCLSLSFTLSLSLCHTHSCVSEDITLTYILS